MNIIHQIALQPAKAFQFLAPTHVHVSEDAAQTLAEVLAVRQYQRPYALVDKNVGNLACVRRLLSIARSMDQQWVVKEVEAREPDGELIDSVVEGASRDRPDVVIGIGGGSTLDLAKAVAVLAFNPGRAVDYQGWNLLKTRGCPTILMPTTAGSGSEATPGAVILNRESMQKRAISSPYMFPTFAILDPALPASAPPQIAAASGVDALAHAIESFAARSATPMSRILSAFAFCLIANALPLYLRDTSRIDLVRNIQLGATVSGMAICNADTGACHSMSYALGVHYGVPHAVAVTLLLPHVLDVNMTNGASSYDSLMDLLSPEIRDILNIESDHPRRLQRFISQVVPIGLLPKSLRVYGIGTPDIPFLAEQSLVLRTALSNNPVPFRFDEAESVLHRLTES